MKSQALQEMVKTIFKDEKTRAQFEANPETVMSQFALTDEEKRAVLSTHAKIGLGVVGESKLDGVGPVPLLFWQ